MARQDTSLLTLRIPTDGATSAANLVDLLKALDALHQTSDRPVAELVVHSVREGSLIIELGAQLMTLGAAVAVGAAHVNSIVDLGRHLRSLFDRSVAGERHSLSAEERRVVETLTNVISTRGGNFTLVVTDDRRVVLKADYPADTIRKRGAVEVLNSVVKGFEEQTNYLSGLTAFDSLTMLGTIADSGGQDLPNCWIVAVDLAPRGVIVRTPHLNEDLLELRLPGEDAARFARMVLGRDMPDATRDLITLLSLCLGRGAHADLVLHRANGEQWLTLMRSS